MEQNMHSLAINDRSIVEITGPDAAHFLERLITTDVEKLNVNELLPGALLSPQGKVLFDFLIGKLANGFFIDIADQLADTFAKRLKLYKLRSDVEISESIKQVTTISWENDSVPSQNDSGFTDKRFPDNEKVIRRYDKNSSPTAISEAALKQWDLLRIQYAIPESGKDFALNDVFPHDINFDQLGAISYKKGCYVGQEIVSRMHHRGTARRRTLIAEAEQNLPSSGTIEADGKTIGELGTVIDRQALALARIDRTKAAMDNGIALTVNGIPLTLRIAPNMQYDFPENISEGE